MYSLSCSCDSHSQTICDGSARSTYVVQLSVYTNCWTIIPFAEDLWTIRWQSSSSLQMSRCPMCPRTLSSCVVGSCLLQIVSRFCSSERVTVIPVMREKFLENIRLRSQVGFAGFGDASFFIAIWHDEHEFEYRRFCNREMTRWTRSIFAHFHGSVRSGI